MPVRNMERADPIELLTRAFGARRPGAEIEQMEKEGQLQLCQCNDSLPAEMSPGLYDELIAAGVKIGDPFPDDPIFAQAKLPAGWKIVPTDHDMWTTLVDAEGKERASIFYKAAFYDRRAFMRAP